MSENKCFCHLNGYEVKDAKARAAIEELKANGTGGGSTAEKALYLHEIAFNYDALDGYTDEGYMHFITDKADAFASPAEIANTNYNYASGTRIYTFRAWLNNRFMENSTNNIKHLGTTGNGTFLATQTGYLDGSSNPPSYVYDSESLIVKITEFSSYTVKKIN